MALRVHLRANDDLREKIQVSMQGTASYSGSRAASHLSVVPACLCCAVLCCVVILQKKCGELQAKIQEAKALLAAKRARDAATAARPPKAPDPAPPPLLSGSPLTAQTTTTTTPAAGGRDHGIDQPQDSAGQ